MTLDDYPDLISAIASAVVKIPGLTSFRVTPRHTSPKSLALWVQKEGQEGEVSISIPGYLEQCGNLKHLDWIVECAVREIWAPLIDEMCADEDDDETEGEDEFLSGMEDAETA